MERMLILVLLALACGGCSVTLSAFAERSPSPVERQRIEVTIIHNENWR